MATTNTAGKETISIKVADKDIFAILRTFKVMDKIASDDLRNVAQEIAVEVKNAIISNASFAQDKNGKDISRQAIAVARSVKVERDRIPKIAIGGSSVVTSSGARAGTLVFGVEFGSYNKKIYRPDHLKLVQVIQVTLYFQHSKLCKKPFQINGLPVLIRLETNGKDV